MVKVLPTLCRQHSHPRCKKPNKNLPRRLRGRQSSACRRTALLGGTRSDVLHNRSLTLSFKSFDANFYLPSHPAYIFPLFLDCSILSMNVEQKNEIGRDFEISFFLQRPSAISLSRVLMVNIRLLLLKRTWKVRLRSF